MMNYQARRLTQDLVAAALESSAHHEKLAAESRRLAGTEKVASESQPMDDSYSTELVEKLASAVEEILPEVELKEAGALESIGDTVARGATRAADFASKHNTGAGAAIARNLQKVQGVDNRTLGKAALGVAGVGAAGVGAGMAAHKAMGSNEKKAAEDDAKVAGLADKLKGVADKVRGAAGKAGDKAKEVAGKAKDKAVKAKDTAKEVVNTALDGPDASWLRRKGFPARGDASATGHRHGLVTGLGVGFGSSAAAANVAKKSKKSKKEASVDPEKLAGAVEKIKSGLKRGKELLSGSKLDALKDKASKIQDPVRKIEHEVTRLSPEHKKVVGARAAAGVGAAATTAGAGLAAHKAMSNSKEAGLATFLSSKRASLVEMAEGKSFQQSPPSSNPQPTVTDVDQKPTNASGNHLPTNESAVQFSNRKTLPERRASMRNYFSQPMNDQHDVPEFSHKTASASDEARALLSQLAEGK
jgi:hypothetical protein